MSGRRTPKSAWIAIATLAVAADTHAERHIVQRGETVSHVARAHGCTTSTVMRANQLQTTLVPPGTVIDVPRCVPASRARGSTENSGRRPPSLADDKARQALAIIDNPIASAPQRRSQNTRKTAISEGTRSPIDGATWISRTSRAWKDRLEGGRKLQAGQGYEIRRPARAYGASHVVDHIRYAIAEVRALYPSVHKLAIGDLSAPHGGKIANHLSHRSGLDVDIGMYFKRIPPGYPDRFSVADANLDLQATWALVTAFARTAPLDSGVAVMFLDYGIQRRLYNWARQRGTPESDLSFLFQYPRNSNAQIGLVRHWPQHADHVHVRFKPGA